jgi:hypothetical protein
MGRFGELPSHEAIVRGLNPIQFCKNPVNETNA